MGEQVDARLQKKSKAFLRKTLRFFYPARKRFGGVAQMGEHLPCKQGVMSSNLTISIVCKYNAPRNNVARLRASTLYR